MQETNLKIPDFTEYLSDFFSGVIPFNIERWKPSDHYLVYKIRQGKRGKLRPIQQPVPWLMDLQRKFIPHLEKYPFHSACMARKGRNIADNAAVHADAKYVLRVDISKCYPSVTGRLVGKGLDMVRGRWIDEGKNWRNVAIGIANMGLWDSGTDWVLPTGAPTSPLLCNIALTPIDEEISKVAKDMGYQYTRYIDDLHLSTTHDKRDWSILDIVKAIVEKRKLKINQDKTRWYTVKGDPVIITGVRISGPSRTPKGFKRMLRARLNNLARENKEIDAETRGCLAYIKSIDPERHDALLDYYQRRLKYVPKDPQQVSPGP